MPVSPRRQRYKKSFKGIFTSSKKKSKRNKSMLLEKNLKSMRFTGEISKSKNFTATKFIPQIAATRRSKKSDTLSFSTGIYLIDKAFFVNSFKEGLQPAVGCQADC
jgi:hypothetical protein